MVSGNAPRQTPRPVPEFAFAIGGKCLRIGDVNLRMGPYTSVGGKALEILVT